MTIEQSIEARRAMVGRRVRLIRCDDAYTRLSPGSEGTVSLVDDMGTVHVNWDNGCKLGLIAQAGDRWEMLPMTGFVVGQTYSIEEVRNLAGSDAIFIGWPDDEEAS